MSHFTKEAKKVSRIDIATLPRWLRGFFSPLSQGIRGESGERDRLHAQVDLISSRAFASSILVSLITAARTLDVDALMCILLYIYRTECNAYEYRRAQKARDYYLYFIFHRRRRFLNAILFLFFLYIKKTKSFETKTMVPFNAHRERVFYFLSRVRNKLIFVRF